MLKSCINPWCHLSFEITQDDLAFYEKVSPVFNGKKELIPPPTRCPECRMQRRMRWRNEQSLYRRTCELSGKNIISSFSSGTPFPVFERSEWLSDHWDPMHFGRSVDLQHSFFDQITQLLQGVPRAALHGKNTENCEYSNFCFDSRNCYMTPCSYCSESLLYSYWMLDAKDCVDSSYLFKSERCYECSDCNHAYGCLFCTLCHSCIDCMYSYDCIGCSNCFGCVGLRHAKYCIFNEQVTQDKYEKTIVQIRNTFASDASLQHRWKQLRASRPRRSSIQEKTVDCTGDFIFESARCSACFQTFRSEDCMYMQDSNDVKDGRDIYHAGWSQLLYETYSPVRLQASAFTSQCWDGSDLLYCDTCQSCSHCFGCVALKHARFCILNTQYSKEEYERLVPLIIHRMRRDGEWGEFLQPIDGMSAYNETMAQEYFPLTKNQSIERGFLWSDYKPPIPTAEKIIKAQQLPGSIDDVPDDILQWAIECEVTKRPFKIIKQELDFYRTMRLPVPRLHPDERHRRRMALRNPRKLWSRTCAKCQKPISTSYSPERPEIVVCEECYLKEVY